MIYTAFPIQINPEYLRPGDVTLTWCRVHMDRTEHLYRPGTKRPMTCLECHPELDPRKAQEATNVLP